MFEKLERKMVNVLLFFDLFKIIVEESNWFLFLWVMENNITSFITS